MIPELGKYAPWVLSAYGISLALLAGIVVLSILQSRRTRRALQAMEARRSEAADAARPAVALKEGANG